MLTKTLLKFISLFKKNADRQDIRIFLESSPQYPNLLSVLQTLRYAGLTCRTGRCDWDYLSKMKSPFLLHFMSHKNEKLIISKWDTDNSELKNLNFNNKRWITGSQEKVMKYWDGVVIYDDSETLLTRLTKPTKSALAIIFALISIATIAFFVYFDVIICYSPIILGLLFGSCLFFNSITNNVEIIDQICHISKVSDCNRIDNSKYSNILGLKLNWLVLSFFISQFLTVLIGFPFEKGDLIYPLYFVSAITCLPAVTYSIYGQCKIKKLCPFCIAVALCLIAEAIIFGDMDNMSLNINVIILFSVIFVISTIILRYIGNTRNTEYTFTLERINLLKLKRNEKVIFSESAAVNEIKSPMTFGDKNSRVIVTTIISPRCRYCRELVSEMITLQNKGLHFYWKIILGQSKRGDSNVIHDWIQRYIIDKNIFYEDLTLWSKNSTQMSKIISNCSVKGKVIEEIHNSFEQQMANLNITGFPKIILNDRLLSTIYTAKDLEFLIYDRV